MELSVCMMVKDEEKNLKRCLDSLKPLTEALDSELIIVDTGSADTTVDIAKKYTDKVYFKQWRDNFSEIRNYSISLAVGEWILIIDADEELQDAANIIVFFKDKMCRDFNSGMLFVHNLSSLENNFEYVVLSSPRLFRNDGSFRYEGSVHNQPVFKRPTVTIDSILKHYGYIKTDNELMEKKFIRTAGILKAELDKDPENIYYRHQMAVSYAMHSEHDKALKEELLAYDLIKEKGINPRQYFYVYIQLAKSLISNNRNSEAEKICLEGIQLNNDNMDLFFYLGHTSKVLKDYKQAIYAYENYLKLHKSFLLANAVRDGAVSVITSGFIDIVRVDIAKIHFEEKDYEKVIFYSELIEDEKIYFNVLEVVSRSLIRLKNFKALGDLYYGKIEKFGASKVKVIFQQCIESEKKVTERIDREILNELFSKGDDSYSLLNKIRVGFYKEDSKLDAMIDKFVDSYSLSELPFFYGDMIYYITKTGKHIINILSKVTDHNLILLLDFAHIYYKSLSEVLWDYLKNTQIEDTLAYVKVRKVICRYLISVDNEHINDNYRALFEDYKENGIKYLKFVYNESLLNNEEEDELKSPEDAFLMYMFHAEIHKSRSSSKYVNYLRKALKVFPYTSKGISMLLKDVESEIANSNEYEECKAQLKLKISELVSENRLEEAKDLIKSYEEYETDDAEIASIRSVIAMMEGRLDEAELHIINGLKLDKYNADLLCNSSIINKAKGDISKAKEDYIRLKLYNPGYYAAADEILDLKTEGNAVNTKVLHGTMEIANQMHEYSAGLEKMGVHSKTVCYYPNHFRFKSDYVYDISGFKDINSANLFIKDKAVEFITGFDVFHFHFGTSLTLDKSDLPLLKELNKKVFMNYWGSECRLKSKAERINPYITVKFRDEDAIKRNLELLGKYIKHAIVADYELYEYVKDFHEYVHLIPQAIEIGKYKVEDVSNQKPIVVHAPTAPAIKGTKYVLEAVNKLKKDYDFEFILVENMPHEEAMKIYSKADIIINSVLEGAYGIFAIECMALGKPVIGWICDFMREKYPEELPIYSTNPDNLTDNLERLLNDPDMRKVIGHKGRAYVEKYHDNVMVASELLKLYNKV